MNDDIPIFKRLVEGDNPPTFEPVISHEDFLRKHKFTVWLAESEAKAHALTGRDGGFAVAAEETT